MDELIEVTQGHLEALREIIGGMEKWPDDTFHFALEYAQQLEDELLDVVANASEE